jgi:alkanesulfonate monooxygenase SsuD/methylene tetrahydromethanopterin reductase-like flavin-dependent oxidoreductase (luciferase family)
VKLGFFTMPLHPPQQSYVETLKQDRSQVLAADRLGFCEAFVGEHVTDLAESVTSCAVFLASLIHDTKQIKLGTGTLNLPNGHPAQLAATVAMLDNMLEGRFIMGISPGGLPSDWEVFENLSRDRKRMFVECIDHMLAIWRGDAPYDLRGEYWNISTARTMLPEIGQGIIVKPYQKPHPPIVVTAVEPFSSGVTEAAAHGWEPISANFLMPVWVKSHWDKYVEGCRRGGRPADPVNWRVAKTVFVADDDATAKRYGFGPESPYRFYYRQLLTKLIRAGRANLFKTAREVPDDAVTLDFVCDRLIIAGTVNKVVDELLAFSETVGEFGTLLYCGIDWADAELGRRSMELMAEEVLPAVNRALAKVHS